MSIQTDAKVRELERRIDSLETTVEQLRASLADLQGEKVQRTLTLPEKRKSA